MTGRAPSRRGLIGGLVLGGVVVVAGGVGAAVELGGGSGKGGTGGGAGSGSADGVQPFAADFGAGGLVTNEYAYREPNSPQAHDSADWIVTSGSLFAQNGDGWTGVPDSGETGTDSARYNDSAVFRLVTRRRDFGDVAVATSVKVDPPITTKRTPASEWDGAHFWLRYHSPSELYALSFRRRDGMVVIKRKVTAHDKAAVDGGDYTTLAQASFPIPYGSWQQVAASAVNGSGGTVKLTLTINGRTALTVVDTAPGALTQPGGVGLRVDNSELWFRDFTATPLSG
ncbi:hypothetical protein [Streptacidiphilus sp. P02-A3a]|uniref:hypothetical protein n=1 Tax=Streptacidiphilus sp. P02-A3a TaxID=2704468 RepID=UPI0015F9CD2D|nr:hypothetical protein [Streptacidiphilus sp. P02-A3a]QMU68171.1 hypothetical protein GXP74_07995 [Streptacidiphilus sp. P02-A3a]